MYKKLDLWINHSLSKFSGCSVDVEQWQLDINDVAGYSGNCEFWNKICNLLFQAVVDLEPCKISIGEQYFPYKVKGN